MMITKRALSRRTVLRGAGATIALPLLDAMVPALSPVVKTAANPVRRLGFVYSPNGQAISKDVNYWHPKGEEVGFEFSPILKPLEPFRDQIIVIGGLRHLQADALGDGTGQHTRSTAVWLNGVHPKKTEGADIRAGITADQIAAREIGRETALPSLEMAAFDLDGMFLGDCETGYSCAYLSTLSWSSETTPVPTTSNPRVVFERLFGDGGTADERRMRSEKDRSILDWVTDAMKRLTRTLGPSDRQRVSEYFDAIRELERRIQKVEERNETSTMPAVLERPLGIPERFDDHCRLMYDLQWLAFQADLTRVATFMLGKEQTSRTFPEIGVPEPWHATSHHQGNRAQLAKLAKLNVFNCQVFADHIKKLQETPDGDGSLLEHTMYLYGAGMSDPNDHLHYDLPLALVGGMTGRFKGGRHMMYPAETPMTNLLVSMLESVGVSVEQLGDSTGRLEPSPLAGL